MPCGTPSSRSRTCHSFQTARFSDVNSLTQVLLQGTETLMPDRFETLRLGDVDRDATIWRYLTFEKLRSLLDTGALWFSKLSTFEDQYEGLIPGVLRPLMRREAQKLEAEFSGDPALHQVLNFVTRNESDGRELIVANCWFAAADESRVMWDRFAGGSDGVVLRSTAGRLADSLAVSHRFWWLGPVNYVDFDESGALSRYEAQQAHLRAFHKRLEFRGEEEVRVATMNWIAPGCLNADGSPPDEKQRAGLVFTPGRKGLYVRVNLPCLISEVRTAPDATQEQREMAETLVRRAGVAAPVVCSAICRAS
jgi:hypothetical protein